MEREEEEEDSEAIGGLVKGDVSGIFGIKYT